MEAKHALSLTRSLSAHLGYLISIQNAVQPRKISPYFSLSDESYFHYICKAIIEYSAQACAGYLTKGYIDVS